MSVSASPASHHAAFRMPRSLDLVALLQALCAMVWLPQAAVLAYAVSRLQQGSGFQSVILPAVFIVALGAVRAVIEAWASTRLHDGARACLVQWRQQAVSVLAGQSPLDRNRIAAGAAAGVLGEQAEAIMPWLTRYRTASWRARIMPLVILIPVVWLSWACALVLMVAAPLIPMFMAIVGWRAKAASEAQWLKLGDMNAFLLDRLRGLPTLRAFGGVRLTAQRLRVSAEDLRQRTMRVLRIAFLSSAVLELFSALGVALVAVYIGFHLLGQLDFGAWGHQLTLAEGLFILLLAPAFFEPLRELAAVWHDKASGQAAVEALENLARGGIPVVSGGGAITSVLPADTGPCVRVRSLAFGFPDERPLFTGLDLSIQPGEKIALVGPSGAGKTVVLSLLAGLLPPQSGVIEIGDQTLETGSGDAIRARIGWMGQRPHVFAGSVASNVALASNAVDLSVIAQATLSAGLEPVAQAHPSVLLGEGGVGLSGGEAARLALARLLAASGKDLWLVDEPTAHLDSATASLIRQALLDHSGRRTLVVATHDPALIARMDRVITVGDASAVVLQGGSNV